MSADDDRSLFSLAREALARRLQPAEPDTFVEGGGNLDRPDFRGSERDREQLERYETAYREGGPVAALVDTRALMTFGTGAEFIVPEAAEPTGRTAPNGAATAAEWLNQVLPDLDNTFVRVGRDNYIYGDAFLDIVETRDGDVSHLVTVNPKTIKPRFDDSGTVRQWIQTIKPKRGMERAKEQTFGADEIGHIALHRLGRHPLGVSLLGRNWDAVQRFRENQHAIAKTIERHGHRKWWVKVGREGGQAIDDNEMRRVRQRFQRVKQNDALITGRDVEIDAVDEGASVGDGIGAIAENDLTMLAAGFGVPEEMAGLGRGSTEATAKVRLQAFERTARAEQRTLASQFTAQVARPLLAEYSPFPRDAPLRLSFDDVVSDQAATAEWLRDFKGIYTPDEMREKLGDGPVPDDVDEGDLGVPEAASEGETADGFFMGDAAAGTDGAGERGPGRTFRGVARSPAYRDWEATFHDIYEHALWAEDGGRALFEFDDEDVPEFVKERLREAVLSDTFFSDFETVPDAAREDLRTALLDSLETQHGWSITSLRENLQNAVPELSDTEAERIARTETHALVAEARERGYRDKFDVEEQRFAWVGPSDDRTTEVCATIKERTPPGGLPLPALKTLVQTTAREFGHDPREWTPHISCRHTYTRQV